MRKFISIVAVLCVFSVSVLAANIRLTNDDKEEMLQLVLLESADQVFPNKTITLDTSLMEMRMYKEVDPRSIRNLFSNISSRLAVNGCNPSPFSKDLATSMYFDIKFDGRGHISTIKDLLPYVRNMANCP